MHLTAFLLLCLSLNLVAQNPANQPDAGQADTTANPLPIAAAADSLATEPADSGQVESGEIVLPASQEGLDSQVDYSANDSIIYDIENGIIYLYNGASVKQEDMSLDAGQIIFDQKGKTVTATALPDSLGNMAGKPVFGEGDQAFEADELTYNFETKKGKLHQAITQEGEGYLRAEQVKKNEMDEIFGQNAYYTTCNLEHPHFKIMVNKVKVIPDKLIVSGPANLVISDVRTPLFLPFAIFPLTKGQTSGVILPSYGFSPTQGYYLRGGGFYIGGGQYMDFSMTGDIYSRGNWRVNATTRYKKRYKFTGNVSLDYGRTRTGEKLINTSRVQKDFAVRWRHAQDAKARPYSNFSANVNFRSSTFNTQYEVSNDNVLTNTITSSISYSKSFAGSPFSLTLGANHSQNTNTRIVDLTLPNFSLNMSRQFPFKRKVAVGKQRWYEKIGITYSTNARASVSLPDSLFFTSDLADNIRTGMKHNTAISTDFKLLKYINITPSIRYNEFWYIQSTQKTWIDSLQTDTTLLDGGGVLIDTVSLGYVRETEKTGFKRGGDFGGSIGITTKLYGMFNFKRRRVKAIRHEVTPNVSLNFRPDFSRNPWNWGYYESMRDNGGAEIFNPEVRSTIGRDTLYSVFEDGIYGGPPRGRQTSVSFQLNNNIQMKVQARKDTAEAYKKIRLLDRLSFRTSYDFAKDSMRLAPFSISAGTNLFGKLNFDFSTIIDPYITDENGRNLDTFTWKSPDHRLSVRTARINLNTSVSSKELGGGRNIDNARGSEAAREEVRDNPGAFVDFKIPWTLRADYTLSLTRQVSEGVTDYNITQTLNLNGQFNLTPNWRVAVSTGYDFTNKEFARTTLDIYRDLHCWEMSFFLAPFGAYRWYEFRINVKASILQDLKLSRKRNWQDF